MSHHQIILYNDSQLKMDAYFEVSCNSTIMHSKGEWQVAYLFLSDIIASGMLNFPCYYWYDIYQSLMLFWSKNVGSLEFITTGVPGSIYAEATSAFTCISDLAWLLMVFYTFLIGILYKLHLLVYILIFQYCVQL